MVTSSTSAQQSRFPSAICDATSAQQSRFPSAICDAQSLTFAACTFLAFSTNSLPLADHTCKIECMRASQSSMRPTRQPRPGNTILRVSAASNAPAFRDAPTALAPKGSVASLVQFQDSSCAPVMMMVEQVMHGRALYLRQSPYVLDSGAGTGHLVVRVLHLAMLFRCTQKSSERFVVWWECRAARTCSAMNFST